jgi:tetratricopeptide (TPR) repeat protein
MLVYLLQQHCQLHGKILFSAGFGEEVRSSSTSMRPSPSADMCLNSACADILCGPHHHIHNLVRYPAMTLGSISNLDEAVVCSREAPELCPLQHPDRPQSDDNLATCLFARYGQLRMMNNLEETIICSRKAPELCLPGHRTRACSLNNLAHYLVTQYDQLGVVNDLKEATTLAQEALELSPRGNPGRSCSLANYLTIQYNQLGITSDLERALVLSRKALELCPSGHPFRL